MADDAPVDRDADEPHARTGATQPDEAEAALRRLVEMDPAAFLKLIGEPVTGSVQVIETGIFPNILPIDWVLRVTDSKPWIAVVALATSPDPDLLGLLEVTFATILVVASPSVPIEMIAVLVRPEADDPDIDGEVVRLSPGGQVNFRLRYRAIRAWQHPPDRPLGDATSSGLATLARSGLPELIAELRERATPGDEGAASESVMCLVFALPEQGEVDPELLAFADQLEQAAPCVLLSLDRRSDPRVVSLQEGCAVMRWKLYQQGTRKLGAPDERIASEIGAITSPRRLSELDRFLAWIDSQDLPITTWDELLAWRTPAQ